MQGENVFITGGAGTGKSYILRQLREFVPELKNNITSTTGVSAINIEGVTINSWARFLFNFDYKQMKSKDDIENEISERAEKSARYTKKEQKEKIQKTKILAIDEISMLSDVTFRFLDLYLQSVRGSEQPFGGIQMVIIGDFCQLPPVTKDKNINDKSLHYAFLSESWKNLNLKCVLLKTFHRQEKDIEFAKCLDDLRFGKNVKFAEKYFSDCIVKDTKFNNKIIHVYQTNKDVRTHNEECLNRLKTYGRTLNAENYFATPYENVKGEIDYITDKTKEVKEEDYLNKKNGEDEIENDTKAANELKLKNGCKVMVIKNIGVENGIANGTIGYVSSIYDDCIFVNFESRENYQIKKEDFIYYDKYKKIYFKRRQFPLMLAYAITIHKAQGLTFDEGVVVNIKNDNHISAGQTYVALSRVRTKDKLHILNKFPTDKIIVDNDVVKFYETIAE